jgi:cation:H+ antiporter
MIALWILLFVVSLTVAIAVSQPAINYARALAASLGAPPFVVGAVLVSIGTDLPEIANSIAAHVLGEGDINVGDSVGSALTQSTFVLGLFPVVVAVVLMQRRQVGFVGAFTMVGLALTVWFVSDGFLSRWEGAVLVLAWLLLTLLLVRLLPGGVPEAPPLVRYEGWPTQVVIVVGTLAVVAWAALLAVYSISQIAEAAGVPEFLIAFFGASLGTSAPELVVDAVALLRGAPAIALGDVLGSSFVDATLSIGIGPLVAPAAVTAGSSVTAGLYTMAAIGVVTVLLLVRRRHDRISGLVLVGLYLAAYPVVIGGF